MNPSSVILLRELHVEELTLRDCALALDGFRIFSGTYRIDLSGSMLSDLLPLVECRGLMELDPISYTHLPERGYSFDYMERSCSDRGIQN